MRKSLHTATAFLLIGAHFFLVFYLLEPAYSTPDANGYFKQGQLIAAHGRTWCRVESPVQYVGIHWMEAGGDRIYSRYPPGFPLLIAVAYKVFGPHGGIWVNTILITLTLVGLYLLCRMWIGKGWALVAVGAMACNPIINMDAATGDAHAAVAFFLVWGLFLLAHWGRGLSILAAFIAGLMLGVIPAVRYPEALFGIGVVCYILFQLKREPMAWPGAVAAVAGAAIPIVGLMVHNHVAFGAVWKTAYSLSKEQTGFSMAFFLQNVGPYLRNMLFQGVGFMGAFALAGLGMMGINRQTRNLGIVLILLVVPTTLLYLSYYFMLDDHPFSTLRFLLPTFYIYAIACVWGLKLVSGQWKNVVPVTTAVLLILNTFWGVPRSVVGLTILKDANASLAAVEQVAHEHVRPGAVLIAPSHIQQHLDYYGRWRLMDDCAAEGIPMMIQYVMSSKFEAAGDPAGGPQAQQLQFNGSKEDRMLMIIIEDIKRKMKMRPYTAKGDGQMPEALLDELSRWNRSGGDIYWIGRLEDIQDKVPANDRLSVIQRIEPPTPLFPELCKMLPNHADELNQLNDRLWKGLMRLDRFVVNPMGISWLIHSHGGLELVKWTRNADI